jgi:hypothetical protein
MQCMKNQPIAGPLRTRNNTIQITRIYMNALNGMETMTLDISNLLPYMVLEPL